MFSLIKKAALISLLSMFISFAGHAQCAMCRATLENNFSNGEIGSAANINFGILYLFVFPYILISIVAFFWYKKSKEARATGKL